MTDSHSVRRTDHPAGIPPVRKRELLAWAFFDFVLRGDMGGAREPSMYHP